MKYCASAVLMVLVLTAHGQDWNNESNGNMPEWESWSGESEEYETG